MMGEFIIYYKAKIVGGIYDNRLLVKPTKEAMAFMPDAARELPYEGVKEMLLVDNVDDKDYLVNLFRTIGGDSAEQIKKCNDCDFLLFFAINYA